MEDEVFVGDGFIREMIAIKGWFTLWHKHKHKRTYAEAVRC